MFNFLEKVSEVQKDLSTSAFARVLGMNQKTVDLYVKGERKPSVDFVRSICSNFHVSADWLLGLSDEQQPSGQVSMVNSSAGAIAIGGGNAVNRDCMKCPLLKDHLKRFSRAK